MIVLRQGVAHFGSLLVLLYLPLAHAGRDPPPSYGPDQARFQTSDRCLACHNGIIGPEGEEVSFGADWRTSLMANSARDPYWQASVRRETRDHSGAQAAVEAECSACHMPISHYHAALDGKPSEVLSLLPLRGDRPRDLEAADGVSCSVCHQITPERLGTAASFNGQFVVAGPDGSGAHPEYGPFVIDPGLQRVMRSSTEGFQPEQGQQIRSAALCASCHTLKTTARGANGEVIGELPEQMPYQEWLHSDYRERETCQTCHMPVYEHNEPMTRVLGNPRPGVARHEFVAANFFLQRMFARYHDDIDLPPAAAELSAAADRTVRYLQSRAARLSLGAPVMRGSRLEVEVQVENLGGHKLPTAYPSRRAWLHLRVSDCADHVIFESGAFNADGSIQGNDNDADPLRFEPHYREIQSADQVQIYESILGDARGAVTTGLLSAVGYLKDNRLLPHGFDKQTAPAEIAVHGSARDDPAFDDHGDRVRYSVAVESACRPIQLSVEPGISRSGIAGHTTWPPTKVLSHAGSLRGSRPWRLRARCRLPQRVLPFTDSRQTKRLPYDAAACTLLYRVTNDGTLVRPYAVAPAAHLRQRSVAGNRAFTG